MVREISGAETLLVWVETTKGVSNVHAAYSTGECECVCVFVMLVVCVVFDHLPSIIFVFVFPCSLTINDMNMLA